jgi:hypothetical protein
MRYAEDHEMYVGEELAIQVVIYSRYSCGVTEKNQVKRPSS